LGIPLVYFQHNEQNQWGILENDLIHAIGTFPSFKDLLAHKHTLSQLKKESYPFGEVDILSPVTAATKIVCQGVNYSDHRQEGGYDASKPSYNMIFSKSISSLTGPYDPVIKPKHVQLLDYEIELGLVIGKDISQSVKVMDENLHEYVAALVIANDISARDVQIPQEQWEKGKSYRSFCPVGPVLYLIGPEDIPYLHQLELKLWVNGELRQQNNTKNLLYKPAETLTELSGVMDFKVGDLLLTGTPSGVAISSPPAIVQNVLGLILTKEKKMELFVKGQKKNPNYLKNNEIIRATIRSKNGEIDLGMQTNPVQF
jgi:2-keto-4-pentenoate hydratase/2-oxohepta-3-ene-1,7-dioic acid hydratase in catechol pathway